MIHKSIASALFMVFAATTAFGFGKPEHSSVEVKTAKTKDALSFAFVVKADDDMAITFDAPWKLVLEGTDGLTFEKTEFKKAEMDQKLPGWTVATKAAPSKDKGEISYKLTAFICTKDKTKCYREVHKGKTSWSKSMASE